jgi:hypothetical protein
MKIEFQQMNLCANNKQISEIPLKVFNQRMFDLAGNIRIEFPHIIGSKKQ